MTPLRKHSGKRVFPLADTLRFLVFPSLRFQRNRNTFLHVSDRFPFQESRISAIVNVCLCCGNAIFRTGNLLFRSFYWRKRERYGLATWLVFLCFRLFPLLRKYVQKVSYLPKPVFPMAIFLHSYMKLTFEYFSWLTYMQWRIVHYISQTNSYHHKTKIHLCCIKILFHFLHIDSYPANNAYLWSYLIRRSCKVNITVACLEGIK